MSFSMRLTDGEYYSDLDHDYCLILKLGFRIAAVPLFPGLRRFSQGRDFKQWTGDDSKALMKVISISFLSPVVDI